MFRKLFVLLAAFALVFCTLPKTAQAANQLTINLSSTLTSSAGYNVYLCSSATEVCLSGGYDYILTGSTTAYQVIVEASCNITLDGVNIDVRSYPGAGALTLNSGVAVNLTLVHTNTLKSGQALSGIRVNSGTNLTITPESTGSLDALGGPGGAGIGGGQDDAGTIIIQGGTIHATGGGASAGIGGGVFGSGGSITISGGTVVATGGSYAAGIGGGENGAAGDITISGGLVIASSPVADSGAGIGMGMQATNGGTINITGGIIFASSNTSDVNANDIGKGYYCNTMYSSMNVNISGSASVFSKRDRFYPVTNVAAGFSHNNVTISGGKVYGQNVPSGWTGSCGAYLHFFTLSYDANGGSGSVADPVQWPASMSNTIATGSGLSLNKHHFAGWNTAPDGVGMGYTAGDEFTFLYDTTLYAQWPANTYSVIYNANGGSGTTPSSSHTCGVEKALTANGYSRTGYSFAGWAESADGDVQYTNGQQVLDLTNTDGATFTLYAKWTPVHYTITYHLNGGTLELPNPDDYTVDTDAFTLNNPEKTGYEFAGWSGTGLSGNSTGVTVPAGSVGDRDYTAHWTLRTYNVNFESNGGSDVDKQLIAYGYKVVKPDNPNKTGYSLDGWYQDSNLTIIWNFKTNTVTTDMTLYAKWVPVVYTITYYLDGAAEPSNPGSYTIETETFTLNNPEKTGYAFAGWSGTGLSGKSTSVTIPAGSVDDRDFTANWAANTYTVSYDANGGTGTTASSSHAYDAEKCLATNGFTRTGYTFAGWAAASDGTVAYADGQSVKNLTNEAGGTVTLYAVWTANTYTVSYDPNGGTGTTASSSHTYDAEKCLTTNGFTRTGYTFAGWAAASDGAVAYTDGQSVKNLTNEAGGTVTLFAVWYYYAVISPAVEPFDKNPAFLVDVKATVTWNNATSVTDVKAGGITIGAVNYSVNKNTLTIKVAYLATQSVGNLALTVEFDIGAPAVLTVAIHDTRINTVTFDSQGGSAVASKTGLAYNSLIKAPATPTRTGYTFAGWYKEAACANAWIFTKDRVTDNITLYANWTPNTYKVTFSSQGGRAVAAAYAQYNTGVTKPADPTRTGYTFAGWYREAACATAWEFDKDKVQGNITLYANWSINYYDVSFDSRGGGTVEEKTHTVYNTTFPAPLMPERTGYTFKGWYKEAACKHAWAFAKDKMPASNITLFAKWSTNSFAVTFNSHGGSSVKGKTASYGTLIAAPAAPKRTGYIFGGWYKEESCATAWDFGKDTVTAATTLWAKWTINSYAISFNMMGGTGTPTPVSAEYGATIALPAAPTKDGFIFAGWYTSAKYTAQWNFATGKVTANTTLFAKWSLTAYTVSFNTLGGSPASVSQSVPYNGKATEPTPPAKAGCVFGGWYTSKSVFTDANQWDFDTRAVTGNITLYARWVSNLGTPSITAMSTADKTITITFQPMPYVAHYCVSVFTGPDMTYYLYQLDSTASTLSLTDADANTAYWFKGWVYTIVDGKTVFGSTTGFVPEGPAQPDTLKAVSSDYRTVNLTWGGTSYRSTGYEVWRTTPATGKYVLVGSPAAASFADTINTGTTYWYKVRAYRLNGAVRLYGAFSDAVSAQCQLADITSPAAASAGANSVTVSWDAVPGAAKYEVWGAPADTGVFKLLTTTALQSFTQTKLVTGQPFYYKVRTYTLVSGKKVYGDITDILVATPGDK